MKAEIESLKEKRKYWKDTFEKEHDNFLAVHRDNLKAIERIVELKAKLLESEALEMRLRGGLERIANLYHRAGKESIWEAMREIANEALNQTAPPIADGLKNIENLLLLINSDEYVPEDEYEGQSFWGAIRKKSRESLAAIQSMRGGT